MHEESFENELETESTACFSFPAPYVNIDMNPVVTRLAAHSLLTDWKTIAVVTIILALSYSEDKDLVYKDAVFFSMHKFVGGVDSPGIEMIKLK